MMNHKLFTLLLISIASICAWIVGNSDIRDATLRITPIITALIFLTTFTFALRKLWAKTQLTSVDEETVASAVTASVDIESSSWWLMTALVFCGVSLMISAFDFFSGSSGFPDDHWFSALIRKCLVPEEASDSGIQIHQFIGLFGFLCAVIGWKIPNVMKGQTLVIQAIRNWMELAKARMRL